MIQLRKPSAVGAAIAVAALTLPAAVAAHPSVYVTSAPVGCTAPSAPYTAAQYLATCTAQTRYVFTNHGNTYLLRESNGKTTGGAISYAHRPGGATGLAAASDFDLFGPPPAGATTGAQPHATCQVPALTPPAVIRSWQGTDPFYAYVPFQAAAVGVDDSAATWLGVVRTATGVDLAAIADTDAAREAACEALPGAGTSSYVPADATQNTLASWSSGQVHLATEPLEHEIAAQSTQIGSLNAASTQSAAQLAALRTEVADLKLALRNLKLTLPATIPTRTALRARGISVTVAGPAQRTVLTRLKISAVAARKLGLRSRILASRSVTLDAAGNATVTLKPTKAAATGLQKARTALEVAADATAGDRYNIVSARLRG